jgi:outer membrane protein
LNWNHQEVPQTDPTKTGTYNMITETALGSLGVQQGLASGTSWNVGYTLSRLNFNSIQSSFDPYLSGSMGLTVVQPLLQGFGTGLNRRFIRIANNNKSISELVFRQQLISTVSDAIRLYWDLVSLDEDLHVKQSAVTLAQKLVEEDQIQVETGTLPPLQLKRSQAELSRTRQDFVNAQNLLLEQELVLKNVLTRNGGADAELAGAQIQPLDRIQVPPGYEKPPTEGLISMAMANRPDLASAQLQLENSRIALSGSKNALRPNLSLVAGVQSNAEAGQLNPWAPDGRLYDPALIGGFGTANSQLFNGTFPNYSLGIQLNLPLRNRTAQADFARDQIQMRQTDVRLHQLENQVRLEVQNAQLSLERAHASYTAAVQTRQLQEEALAAEQERYKVGASTSFYIIQYQRDVTQARSTEVAAEGAYAKAKTALDRVLGTTLENNHISLTEALSGEISAQPTPLPPSPQSK